MAYPETSYVFLRIEKDCLLKNVLTCIKKQDDLGGLFQEKIFVIKWEMRKPKSSSSLYVYILLKGSK
jgi:hypothetical protein